MTMKRALSSSNCSCPDCESMSCFTARRKAENACRCQNCKNSETCLYLANDLRNVKASKTDEFSQIHTESNYKTDKIRLLLHSTHTKIHTCCGKAPVGKLDKVEKTDYYQNNDKQELKLLGREGTDTLHKIQYKELYELSHLDTQSVFDFEDNVHMGAIHKADRKEQTSDICIKDNISLFAMEGTQWPNPRIHKTNAPVDPVKVILQGSKEVISERLKKSNLPDIMHNVVNNQNISTSNSDTTKITDQIRSKLDAYDANKTNKVKSKFGTSNFVTGNAEVSKEQVQKEIVYESESDINMEIKDSTCIQQDSSYQFQPLLSAVRSAALNLSRSLTNKTSAARLSAQIMDVPFMAFHKSLSFDYSADNDKEQKIMKHDLFEKIKDIYKMCTCKVCECITSVGLSSSIAKENCNCKPCRCDECQRYRSPKSSKMLVDNFHNSCKLNTNKGFSDRNSCKARSELCDCKPCECMDCLTYNYLRGVSCDCKPCGCIECKSIRIKNNRTLIVAPVGEDSQHRQYCQCSPCACAECGFSYGHLSPNLTQDTGTSAYYRHTNCHCDSCVNEACTQNGDMCICERRNKLMRKPVRSDKNDYDIHNVIVSNTNNIVKCRKSTARNNHTVAMLASYCSASKPDADYNCNTNRKKEYDNAENLHVSNVISDCYDKKHHRGMNVNWNMNKTSNCLSVSNKHSNRDVNNTHVALDCCDYRGRESYNPSTETFLSKVNTSKDARVSAQESSGNSDLDYFSRRLLMNKNNSSTLFASKPWYLCKKSSTIDNSDQNCKVFCMIPQQLNASILLAKDKYTPIKIDNSNVLTNTSCSVSKTSTECTKCKETDSNTSGSYTSAKSSTLQPELLSSVKNSKYLEKVKRLVNKSSDSGNSSSHDHYNYLFKFPRSTIGTFFNDVLKVGTNIDKTSAKSGSSVEKYSSLKIKKKEQMKYSNSSRKDIKPGRTDNAVDCDKKTSDRLKSQWKRCNCTACVCCELSTTKNKKTEESQTLATGKDKGISTVYCANCAPCLGTSTEDIINKSFILSLVDSQNQKNVFSTNNCNFPFTTSENTKNAVLNQLYDKSNVLYKPNIDNTVENTIQGAKQFSMELLELLHKYEKANREFESITGKLKKAQDSIINKNNDSSSVSYVQRFEEPEKDQVVLNGKEHSNTPVNNNIETPIKMNKVYTTYYAPNIHKRKQPNEVFDSNGELLNHQDDKANCSVRPKKCLLGDYFGGMLDSHIKSNVRFGNTGNTYKAYKKLITKAFRTTRRCNIRKKVSCSSVLNMYSKLESKMNNTESQTKTLSQLKAGDGNECRLFRNIEVQLNEMPKEEIDKHKKGNMNFKADSESKV